MKEISKKEISKKIHEKASEGWEWCQRNYGHYYKIMPDVFDGSIWIDTFVDTNNWVEYHSDTIVQLECLCRDVKIDDIANGYIASAIENLKAAGWTITE